MAETIEMPFGGAEFGGRKEPSIRWGRDTTTTGRDNFWGMPDPFKSTGCRFRCNMDNLIRLADVTLN